MSDVSSPLSGAILTGGQSRRMGQDKALLRLGGATLLERAIDVLRQVCDEVLIVGERPSYHAFGIPVVADAWPGLGALGGIATALRAARHEHVLVVACDMPLLSVSLLRAMAAIPRGYDALVPRTAGERGQGSGAGTWETLHAIYARRCLAPIEAQLAAGDAKVVGFFPHVRVQALDEAWLREHDPELRSLRNANDPDELARLRQEVEEGA